MKEPSADQDGQPYRGGLAAERRGDFQFLADAFGGEFFDFAVTGNCRRYAQEMGYGR